jgi:PAS domain S-box-containing protein
MVQRLSLGEYELLRTLITHTEDFIYIKDRESKFLISNMATAHIMGANTPEELYGKTDFDFYPQDLAATYYADEQKIVQTGLPIVNYEEPGIDHNGNVRFFFTTKVPLKNQAGEVVGIVGIGKDITRRKEAEEILKRDKDTLEKLANTRAQEIVEIQLELEKAKRLSDIGTLAATVAHELRNPLATIQLALANIRRKIKDPVLEGYLGIIDKKIFESDQIINNLLFYSRIKPPHFDTISINAIMLECVDVLMGRARKKITLTNKFEFMEDIKLSADAIQIREVFHNILNNAYDAVDKAHGVIDIDGKIDGNFLHIYVKDNGVGMKEKDLEKAFDTFYTTKAKGTGLGLSVCRQIITLHGGSIKLESSVGAGTTVVISLPLRREKP